SPTLPPHPTVELPHPLSRAQGDIAPSVPAMTMGQSSRCTRDSRGCHLLSRRTHRLNSTRHVPRTKSSRDPAQRPPRSILRALPPGLRGPSPATSEDNTLPDRRDTAKIEQSRTLQLSRIALRKGELDDPADE